MSTTWFWAIWLVGEDPRTACRLSQTRGLGTRLRYLVRICHERWTYGPRSSRFERLVLEEHPHHSCCGRPRTQRLCGTTVPVQDRTGMEIRKANCACANHWFNVTILCMYVMYTAIVIIHSWLIIIINFLLQEKIFNIGHFYCSQLCSYRRASLALFEGKRSRKLIKSA